MQRQETTSPQRIRVLVVDDSPESVQNIQKLLRFERDIQVAGVAASGSDAVERASTLRPDVILMDMDLPDMDGLKATELVTRSLVTCVVIMSAKSEPEHMAKAMMAGARGYLIKPFSGEELTHTVRTAAAAVHGQTRFAAQPTAAVAPTDDSPKLRRIVTVYSPKGGVGRSVLAVNLAIALQQATGKTVALVDANLQSGDAHILLNSTGTTSIDDLREAGVVDPDLVASVFAHPEGTGIALLRAPLSPESAELFTGDTMKAILHELRDYFDYLVIDTDTSFSEATLSALEMADHVLAVTTLEVTTINRVSQFLEVVERLGYPRDKVKLVCNRVDGYYGIRPAQVEARLRTRFLAQIPEDSRLVVGSVNQGSPFTLSQRNSPVSQAIFAIVHRLEEAATKPETATAGAAPREKQRRFGFLPLSS